MTRSVTKALGLLVLIVLPACEAPYENDQVTTMPGIIGPESERSDHGFLVVRTDVLQFEEECNVYHPHRPYEIRDLQGKRLRRVRNHVGMYDELPSRVSLAPGVYRVLTRRTTGELLSVDVRVEAGRVTEIDVNDLPDVESPRS